MHDRGRWIIEFEDSATHFAVDGLVRVKGFSPSGHSPEEVAVMEKAAAYEADAVFFEAGRNGKPPTAQAFVYVSSGPADDEKFAALHKRLWSWGGVPLLYRKTPGLLQLFRCAHRSDFITRSGELICRPIKHLELAASISKDALLDPWWDASQLRSGTLWDDPEVCDEMLSAKKAAHKTLIDAVKDLKDDLNDKGILPKALRRKLLILSLLIAYLEERGVFQDGYFGEFKRGATRYFEVLADGGALVKLLDRLEERFNGHVFVLDDTDRETLRQSNQLSRYAQLIEGREGATGQPTLWQIYSFKDLPVELISHIYQLFVKDADSSVYTPPFLVRLMLDEALSWKRLDRLVERDEIILDPSCGSGVFLVEAYKRLVLHWRASNGWQRPRTNVLKSLLNRVHGIDLEKGAIELSAFSLCLALCDALEPEEIRKSVKLFPQLEGRTLNACCFFDAKESGMLKSPVGVVVGNPPFESRLKTPGAQKSYDAYQKAHGALPDKQVAYLFLYESMNIVAEGGVLSMLQQYNFLYNQQSSEFRRQFFQRWDVREVLDFISVRGLFHKGDADTKVIVMVAEASRAPADRKILHATFRRSGRVDAELGFDIDYYDLHWLPRQLALTNDGVWRADLLGGGRVLALADRLREFRTLGQYASDSQWDSGEGFIEGRKGLSNPASHIIGKPLLPSESLTEFGIERSAIKPAPSKPIEGPRSAARFTPPLLLVREHMDLHHDLWTDSYLTYKNQIVGFAIGNGQTESVREASSWITKNIDALRAFVAATSVKLFTQKATTLSAADILALPYPQNGDLDISENEQILVDDIVGYYRDLIRLGEDSAAMRDRGHSALQAYCDVLTRQVNAIYKKPPLRALPMQRWAGVICQPFCFGASKVDWSDANELSDKLDQLLRDQRGTSLRVTRITRLIDGKCIFLLKPDRLRFWLRSVALRDADEILSDLRGQGF
jgi:hypothetical protein